ncbi:LysR family transcriptional regulator [Reyranella sp.]|uniref:LysR family transcriptional regulator n=1 Tax=Reyranella sp. TaxID=1929291 RepID=UPI003BABEA96
MQYARHLRLIDMIARTGSIRRAADRLGIASSALNRRVQEFEREMGARLFERRPRGVRLTAAGEIVIAHIRSTLSDLEQAKSMVDSLQGVRRGTIRIAAIEALANGFLPEAIAEFLSDHQQIEFKTTIMGREDVVRAVIEFDADIGVVFNPGRDPMFKHVLEIEQALFALMSNRHPLARREQVRLADCAEYPLALPDRSLGGRLLLEEFLASKALMLRPSLEANSFELMREYVRRSEAICFQIGIGTLSAASAGCRAVPVADRGLPKRKLVVGTLRDRVLPVASAMFLEAICARLAGTARNSQALAKA